jgi:hypothetical protein
MLYWRFPIRPRHPLARVAIAVIGAGLLVGVLVLGFFALVAFAVIGGIVAVIRAISRAQAIQQPARPADPKVIEGEYAVIHESRAVRH